MVLLHLRVAERVFFHAAHSDFAPLSDLEREAAVACLILYRHIVQEFLHTIAVDQMSIGPCQLRSKETLITWITVCLYDRSSSKALPTLSRYALPLDPNLLRHVVLVENAAIKAMTCVATYLTGRRKPLDTIFARDAMDATYRFMRDVFSQSSNLVEALAKQRKADAERISKRWKEIQAQKQSLSEARASLAKAEAETATQMSWCAKYSANHIRQLKRNVQLYSHLPAQLNLPLPRSDLEAQVVLVAIAGPSELHCLAYLLFMARQSLLPRGSNLPSHVSFSPEKLAVPTGGHWRDHVVTHKRTDEWHLPAPGKFYCQWCFTSGKSVPSPGPASLDSYLSDQDGVSYPDNMGIHFSWTGGTMSCDQLRGGSSFDPFIELPGPTSTHAEASSAFFTPSISQLGSDSNPESLPHLQCLLATEPTNRVKARGNLGIAYQRARPHWLTPRGFQAFASLRAGPRQQLRRVVILVKEHRHILHRPEVRALVLQALYQVGELQNGEQIWKRDTKRRSFWTSFIDAVEGAVDQQQHIVREHSAMLLLVDLARYIVDSQPEQWQLLKKCGDACAKWAATELAKSTALEAASTLQYEQLAEARARCALFCGYAVRAYASGQWDDTAIRCTLTHLVLLAANSVYAEKAQTAELKTQLAAVQCMCTETLAARAAALGFSNITKDHLTASVRKVLSQAGSIAWQRSPQELCFQGKDGNGDHYFLNGLTGELLINGAPLRSLPSAIRTAEFFVRHFGSRDFEVSRNQNLWTTTRPVGGCTYRFWLDPGTEALSIWEDTETTSLKLINTCDPDEEWFADLPLPLRVRHSFWYSEEDNVIILRGVQYQEKDKAYIIGDGQLWKIPPEDANLPLYDILHVERTRVPLSVTVDLEVVLPVEDSAVSKVHHILAKFEDPQFIHCHINHSDDETASVTWALSRFELSFKLDSKGRLLSNDYDGYELAPEQQLQTGLLPRFRMYLVLTPFSDTLQRTKVLVPDGRVVMNHDRDVQVVPVAEGHTFFTLPGPWARLRAHAYELHRRWNRLCAPDVPSRLQLAALFAATHSVLPSSTLGTTGAEEALRLLRQCFLSRPTTPAEQHRLSNVSQFSAGVPELTCACVCLQHESERLAPFFASVYNLELQAVGKIESPDATSEYEHKLAGGGLNFRRRLSQTWEDFLLTSKPATRAWPSFFSRCKIRKLPPADFNASISTVSHCFKTLRNRFVELSTCTSNRDFPVAVDLGKNNLAVELLDELKGSWKCYLDEPVAKLCVNKEEDMGVRLGLFKSTSSFARELWQRYLQRLIREQGDLMRKESSSSSGLPEIVCSVMLASQAANLSPSIPTVEDLVALTWDDQLLDHLTPLFSIRARYELRALALTFAQFCAWEDKADRLLAHARSRDDKALLKELAVERTWDPGFRPKWLGFEVDGQLQIRPEQAAVAEHLIENPGQISQLNMGLGKTRVVLPLLILHFANGFTTVRCTFLTSLLSEAVEFLHRTLTASVLNVPIFELPFQRDIPLTVEGVKSMIRTVDQCQKLRGFIAVAPEHRLSPMLKAHETTDESLQWQLSCFLRNSFKDILDESDAVLHPRFELVYAMGTPGALEAAEARCFIMQALLLAVCRPGHRVLELLEKPGVSICSSEPVGLTCFSGRRLLGGPALQSVLPQLAKAIVTQVIATPSYEIRWMKRLSKVEQREVVQFVCDPNADTPRLIRNEDEAAHLFALKGALAFRTLFHSLERRNRVDFGINRLQVPGRHRCRLAVPFRASDTPAPRAEFSHPDVVIALTCIAYYYDGLEQNEVLEATQALLSLPSRSAEATYATWFRTVDTSLLAEEVRAIDHPDKLDLGSLACIELLCRAYSKSPEAINFWLASCVFPKELPEFPSRLKLSAWHLCDPETIGFSGTNDCWRLLPLSVRQAHMSLLRDAPSRSHKRQRTSSTSTHDANGELIVPSHLRGLLGTNGRMLDLMLRRAVATELEVEGQGQSEQPLWKRVVMHAVKNNLHALIDAGALTSGVSNAVVAEFVLSIHADEKIRGVIYWEQPNRGVGGAWTVLDRVGRRTRLTVSAVRERDCFVLFDEAHCRGADLKLRRDACALLTLGPQMCKDKLMQAAGRLRELDAGQKLEILVPPELVDRVLSAESVLGKRGRDGPAQPVRSEGSSRLNASDPVPCAPISVSTVLSWVLINTVNSNLKFLAMWADNGVHFFKTDADPSTLLEQDVKSLKELYGPRKGESGPLMLKASHPGLSAQRQSEYFQMYATVRLYTLFDDAIASQQLGLLDQECERELEEEAEEEVVVETECTTLEPRDEYQWDVQQVMQCGSSLPPCLRAVHLRELAHRLSIAAQLSALGLDDADVWVTQNFMFAIDGVSTEFDSFLRFPDVVLVFPSGKLLLISELEAESLFTCWMDGKWPSKLTATSSPMLANWSTLRFADREWLPMMCGMRRWVVHDRELCAMHLFLGEPQLHESVKNPERAAEPPRFDSMRTLLKTKGAGREELEHGVRALMRVRGTVSCYERSHLQYVIETCNEAES